MAVRIRLKRLGAKKRPFYRIVVIDSRTARQGKTIEEIGHYNAVYHGDGHLKIDLERLEYWVGKGASMSDTVRRLVVSQQNGG